MEQEESAMAGPSSRFVARALIALGLLLPGALQAAPVTLSDSGATAADIQATVGTFQFVLGANNGNNPGPITGGRREINWDGGGAVTPSTAGTPFTGFQNTRGATMTTPGTGFIQAAPADLATQFANATYGTTFAAFSPLRLFVPIGSNVTDILFSVPGSGGATPAFVSAFGVIFSDVDTNATSMEFFDLADASLGSFSVPGIAGANATFSFLGVAFNAGEQIGRVRITTGNSALGPTDGEVDVVAMDDFIFSEPTAVPEPGSFALVAFGLFAYGTWMRSFPSKGGE
jgi:hypothetical protein